MLEEFCEMVIEVLASKMRIYSALRRGFVGCAGVVEKRDNL